MRHRKNQEISDLVSNFGSAFELLKAIAHAVMAKGGNMQHLRRIVKGPALQWQIADLVVPAGSEIERPLGENEYLVPVGYDMPRDKAKLEAEFSKGGVSDLFYSDWRWSLHSSCAEIDQTSGHRTFLVKCFNRWIKAEEAIAEMDKQGYRPATHLEAYAFAKAKPELQCQFFIVALGSSTMGSGDRPHVAMLRSNPSGRMLVNVWFSASFAPEKQFLFVRK